MKVAILNTLYHPYRVGGAERSVEILANGLTDLGVQVTIITLAQVKEVRRLQHGHIDVWQIPLRNLYWPFEGGPQPSYKRFLWHFIDNYNFWMRRELAMVLKTIVPDILHTNNLAGFSVSAWDEAEKLGIPIVHTARDYYLIHPNAKLFSKGSMQTGNELISKLWGLNKKASSNKVAKFVGISQYVVDVHRRLGFFMRSDSRVIYNSVESTNLRDNIARGMLHNIGFIGRLDPTKGVEMVLAAAKHFPDKKFLVAGDGESIYVDKLRISAPWNVEFIGKVSPNEFFPKIGALIVPSLWAEPLGRVVLESFSYDVPVLAAAIGGLKELVSPNTGVLFEPGSVASLIGAIEKFSVDYSNFRSECLNRVKSFSVDGIAKSYLEVYCSLKSQVPHQ